MTTRWSTERITCDEEVGARQAAVLHEAALRRAVTAGGRCVAVPGEILAIGARPDVLAPLRRRGWTVAGRAGTVVRLIHPATAGAAAFARPATARAGFAVRPAPGEAEAEVACAELRAAGAAADRNHLVVAAGGYIKFTAAAAEPVASAGHIKFARAAARPTGHRPPAVPPAGEGAGIRVALLDTGFDPRAAHGPLAGVTAGAAHREGPGAGGLLGRATGHGTFCAGIVRQVAPGCEIQAVRVLDRDGLGTGFSVARALFALAAAARPPHVVNLSFTVSADRPPLAVTAGLAALRAAHPSVVVVAAAGNDGRPEPVWPAAAPGVLAVGSPAAYAGHGDWVDVVVPAEGVVSTAVTGVRAGAGGFVEHRRPYAAWTGTSFAAPQVAGLLAVRMSRQGAPVC